jgi:methionine synthase II (cobalamin-independent)
VAEQARAGLGLVGDGGARHPDRLVPLIEGLRGLVAAGSALLPTGERVTQPAVRGAIGWEHPMTLGAWAFAAGLSELPAKQVLIGPYTIGRLTPASRATASIDTAWKPRSSTIRLVASRSCSRRSSALIRRAVVVMRQKMLQMCKLRLRNH